MQTFIKGVIIMNLFLKHTIVGVILSMTVLGAYSAENPTTATPAGTPPVKTVIRKLDAFTSKPDNLPANGKVKPISKKTENTLLKAESLTAEDIIKKMSATYKNCSSYLDSGVVNTTFFMKKGPYVDKVPFATAFKRPAQFRFGFSVKPPKKDAEYKSGKRRQSPRLAGSRKRY
jgi:hypothetical protein